MSLLNPDTLPSMAAPAVLVVSCPPDLVARCAEAAESLALALQEGGFLAAATIAAERRPLAIVMTEDVYAFDPDAFDALARDVRASLVRVEEDIPTAKLELILEVAIEDAARRRRESPAATTGEAAGDGRRAHVATASEQDGRRTVPNPAQLAYRVGQRMPSRADLVAAVWKARTSSPPPPSSRRGISPTLRGVLGHVCHVTAGRLAVRRRLGSRTSPDSCLGSPDPLHSDTCRIARSAGSPHRKARARAPSAAPCSRWPPGHRSRRRARSLASRCERSPPGFPRRRARSRRRFRRHRPQPPHPPAHPARRTAPSWACRRRHSGGRCPGAPSPAGWRAGRSSKEARARGQRGLLGRGPSRRAARSWAWPPARWGTPRRPQARRCQSRGHCRLRWRARPGRSRRRPCSASRGLASRPSLPARPTTIRRVTRRPPRPPARSLRTPRATSPRGSSARRWAPPRWTRPWSSGSARTIESAGDGVRSWHRGRGPRSRAERMSASRAARSRWSSRRARWRSRPCWSPSSGRARRRSRRGARADAAGREGVELTCKSCPDGTAHHRAAPPRVTSGGRRARHAADGALGRARTAQGRHRSARQRARRDGQRQRQRRATASDPTSPRSRRDKPAFQIVAEVAAGTTRDHRRAQDAARGGPRRRERRRHRRRAPGSPSEVKTLSRQIPYVGHARRAAAGAGRRERVRRRSCRCASTRRSPLRGPGRRRAARHHDGPSFVLAGWTMKGAEVLAAGRPIAVHADGTFAQVMNVSSVGATQIEVAREDARDGAAAHPDQGPPRREPREAAARTRSATPSRPSPSRQLAAEHPAAVGKPVALDGEVSESKKQGYQTMMLLEVVGRLGLRGGRRLVHGAARPGRRQPAPSAATRCASSATSRARSRWRGARHPGDRGRLHPEGRRGAGARSGAR